MSREVLQLEITNTDNTISDNASSIISETSNENKKLMGVIYGMGMNVNNIIGAGIFTTPGIVWKQVKSPYIVLALWVIGGIISLCGSLIYTELGTIHRHSGGETIYLATAYSKPYLMASYLFSFMFIFIIRPGIICAVLESAAQYTWYTLDGKPPSIDSSLSGWNNKFKPYWIIKLIAVGLLLIISGYHMLSNKWANKINHTLTIIKTIMTIVIAISGMTRYHNTENWKKPLDTSSNSADFSILSPYSVAIVEIFFSYNGWNNLNYSLDEFRNPEKKLKLSNLYSVGIVTLLYLLVNIAFITSVPADLIIGTNTEDFNETIAADFFSIVFNSDIAARVLSFFVVLSAIGSAATSIWSGSRVIVSAAKSDFFPILSYELKDWHDYFDTPINALCAQFVWCTFFILIVGSSVTVDAFILFTSIAIFSSWIFSIATSIGLVILRKKQNVKPKVSLLIIYFYIISGILIIFLSFFFIIRTKSSYLNNISFILITFISLIVGILFWYGLFYRPHLKEQSRRRRTQEINIQVKIQLAAALANK